MARVYVYIPFTDSDGEHAVNEQLDLPEENFDERANVSRLLDYGIVGRVPQGSDEQAAEKV